MLPSIDFIRLINDKYIPESDRKPLPDDAATYADIQLATWIVINMAMHLNPDKYNNAP